MTAEFAATMPAVILVLACCLASLQLAVGQLRLQSAAGSIVRALAREGANDLRLAGELAGGLAGGLAGRLAPGARIETEVRGELICIRLFRQNGVLPGLDALTAVAASCALAGGR